MRAAAVLLDRCAALGTRAREFELELPRLLLLAARLNVATSSIPALHGRTGCREVGREITARAEVVVAAAALDSGLVCTKEHKDERGGIMEKEGRNERKTNTTNPVIHIPGERRHTLLHEAGFLHQVMLGELPTNVRSQVERYFLRFSPSMKKVT